MRVLVIADQESPWFWDHFQKEKLEGIDLILSCGDLKPQYLSFLATFSSCPVLYIHGNHDENYRTTPPEGCVCIEDTIYNYKGIRILGLGGCMRYRTGEHQYTEAAMAQRVRRLLPRLWWNKGFDVLLTHAPAWQLNDGTDLPHIGFKTFLKLMDRYQPRYFIHGHVHRGYQNGFHRLSAYGNTIVVNAYEYFVLDIFPESECKKES